jgi:hypothetical protein
MTLALRNRTRPFKVSARQSPPEPRIVEVTTPMPISGLDRVLNGMKHDHWRHAEGPIFPCPLCFDPPLLMIR